MNMRPSIKVSSCNGRLRGHRLRTARAFRQERMRSLPGQPFGGAGRLLDPRRGRGLPEENGGPLMDAVTTVIDRRVEPVGFAFFTEQSTRSNLNVITRLKIKRAKDATALVVDSQVAILV